MNELIKIKMSDRDIESWPEVLRNAVDDKNRFFVKCKNDTSFTKYIYNNNTGSKRRR